MNITERIANLNIPEVVAIVATLFLVRFALRVRKSTFAKAIAEAAESLAAALALVFLLIRPFVVQAFFIPSASMHPGLLEHDHVLVSKFVYRFHEPARGNVVVFRAPIDATPDVQSEVDREADERGLTGAKRAAFLGREAAGMEKDFIKRVIAVPGDVVRISPGYVIIDGVQYSHADLRLLLARLGRLRGEGKIILGNDRAVIDGRPISKAEIALAAGRPRAAVKIVPGEVYLNGKALSEPYVAEDPDMPYPLPNTNQAWIVRTHGRLAVKIPKGKLLVMGDNRNDSNDSRFWPSGLLDRRRILGQAVLVFYPFARMKWLR